EGVAAAGALAGAEAGVGVVLVAVVALLAGVDLAVAARGELAIHAAGDVAVAVLARADVVVAADVVLAVGRAHGVAVRADVTLLVGVFLIVTAQVAAGGRGGRRVGG